MHDIVDDDYVGKILIKYFCFKILKIFRLTHMHERKKFILYIYMIIYAERDVNELFIVSRLKVVIK